MLDLRAGAIAADRFGFGAGPGEHDRIAGDPRGWLHAQLKSRGARAEPQSQARLARFLQLRKERKADPEATKAAEEAQREQFKLDALNRTLAAAASPAPFRERLVQFWSNHFTVSIQRTVVLPVALGFEDEAIRPHVTGRFADMLQAVARHPAMLLYLDNAVSIGPNSEVGRRQNKGLNENLAREMLELHTVGVDGGYTQADVTEFARILTGWSVGRETEPDAGAFRFRPHVHEPGGKTLLGRRYAEGGMDEGVAAMNDLAARPETARHLATELARHFVADEPPERAVATLAKAYRDSDGNLGAVSAALIGLPEIWSKPLAKIKTPNDLVTATCRVFDLKDAQSAANVVKGLHQMGQIPFAAPSPAGWADTEAAWISPESVMTRIDWALAAGAKLNGGVDARDVAKRAIGPVASDNTMFHINAAPSPTEAIALLIASPEFQRR